MQMLKRIFDLRLGKLTLDLDFTLISLLLTNVIPRPNQKAVIIQSRPLLIPNLKLNN